MRLILNATPLIHLVKVGFHRYFKDIDIDPITTRHVLKDIQIDSKDFPENITIKGLIKSGVLKIRDPKQMQSMIKGTHTGEISVISLAKETGFITIIDDRISRAYAESLNLPIVYSTFPIFQALKKKAISKGKAIEFLNKMIENGWRCDVESYKNMLLKIEGIGKYHKEDKEYL